MTAWRLSSLLCIVALTSGCAGAGWHPGQVETFTGQSSRPTAQETETLDRIAGQPQPLPAVFTEKGNLWPSEPPRVLTLADLRRDHVFIVRPRPQRGGYGLCRTGARPGVALGIC